MKINCRPLFAILLLMGLSGSAAAQTDIFDNPSNLKVLPDDVSSAELRQTMRGFSRGTGSRCSTCHVGEVERDLTTYDFSLDDKKSKLKAREMIKLVSQINQSIAEAFPHAEEPLVTVTCATCHRGLPKPEMIEDVLARSYHADGLDAAISKYRHLRDQNYGGYSYDFSENVLMRVAERLGMAEDFDATLAFVNLNLEYYPQSVRSYVMRAQVLTEIGDINGARADYEQALAIRPGNPRIQQELEKLR